VGAGLSAAEDAETPAGALASSKATAPVWTEGWALASVGAGVVDAVGDDTAAFDADAT
jgi:hypothetical protein